MCASNRSSRCSWRSLGKISRHARPSGPSSTSSTRSRPGSTRWRRSSTAPSALSKELQAAYDALKLAQSQLVQAGKLAAIGQLSSGVAHEINNPATWAMLSLAVVARELGGLRTDLAADGRENGIVESRLMAIEAALEDAREGVQRISLVAGDLRTFARADDELREPLDLNEVVRISTRIATPAYRLKAKLICEALRCGGGRRQTREARAGRHESARECGAGARGSGSAPSRDPHRDLRLGERRVADRGGLGVWDPPDLRDRVFEPFYTTKPAHQGTGLGLSLVREIIHDHGGEIVVGDSSYGGARIEIRLPGRIDAKLARVADETNGKAPRVESPACSSWTTSSSCFGR